jgi:hypothetical protein
VVAGGIVSAPCFAGHFALYSTRLLLLLQTINVGTPGATSWNNAGKTGQTKYKSGLRETTRPDAET